MKQKKRTFVSRPVKVLCYLFLASFLVATIYILLGSPPLNAEMAFRRAERAHMVGPSRILAEFSSGQQYAKRVIVAETENCHILYVDQRQSLGYRRFYTNPKEGQIDNYTFYTYPKTGQTALYPLSMYAYSPFHLVLFDRCPNAVRAEMEIILPIIEEGQTYYMDIRADATREYDSFFLFSLAKPQENTDLWYSAMNKLSQLCWQSNRGNREVTIRFYDAQNNLLLTESILPGLPGNAPSQ